MGRGVSGKYRFAFTFLIYRSKIEPDKFVAHCLELDVLAVESTKPKAVSLLKELIEDLIEAAIKDDTLDRIFTPAPRKFWRALAGAVPYEPPVSVKQRHIGIPRVRRVDYALVSSQ